MSAAAGPGPTQPIPICPHCEGELAGMALFMWQLEGWLIISPYCPHCRVVLHTQAVPIPPQMAVDEPSRIARPS